MLVGYMRVSSESDRQTTDLQRDAQGLRTKFFWTITIKISDSLSFDKQRIKNVHTTG